MAPIPWSPEEDALIRQHWPNRDYEKIAVGNCRSKLAIDARARKMGLRRPAKHKWCNDDFWQEIKGRKTG